METREIKITLETARRWYENGGEFKDIALTAYKEEELIGDMLYKRSKPKFDPKTLKPFDKVLARINDRRWYADFISIAGGDNVSAICTMSGMGFHKIIPYNEDTKHLVGTLDEAPEFYRYWED